LGGDLTFKAIVPIVRKNDGKVYVTFLGENHVLEDEVKVKALEKRIRSVGFYPCYLSETQVQELTSNQKSQEELFNCLVEEMVKKWVALAEEKLRGTNIKCYISPGNDDSYLVDQHLMSSEYIIYPEEKIVQIDETHEMLTLGVSNITPWHCFRDLDEGEIEKKLEKLVPQIRDINKSIFNVHVPPYGTPLDLAPKLDETLKPVLSPAGGFEMTHVGSHALRKIIEKYQPMLGLHGHIHESRGKIRIGRTLCINPGSEYTEGILNGFLADITEEGIKDYLLTSG